MIEFLVPSLILPIGYGDATIVPNIALTSTETIAPAVATEHTSSELFVPHYGRKTVHVLAYEVVPVAGAPGALNVWPEISPYPSANHTISGVVGEWPTGLPASTLYWAAVGGGGGALAPVAPVVEAGIGVNLTPHTIVFDFEMHAPWVRIVVNTPAPHATSYWLVQVLFSAKGVA